MNSEHIIKDTDRIVRLSFKDEDEDDDGRAIGPVFAYFPDGSYARIEGGWFTKKHARRMATSAGVPLTEV